MIRTCSVRMPTENSSLEKSRNSAAFTLTELVVVILIVSLIVLLVGTNLYGLLVKNTFRGQIQELVSEMQMVAASAAETGKKYEIILDFDQQGYILRQITSPDLSIVLEEEIITSNYFSDNCRLAYVIFDDGDYTNQGRAKFRVGKSGWQYGGKIVLLDATQRPYSIIVNRLNRTVGLRDGDIGFLMPKPQEEVPF